MADSKEQIELPDDEEAVEEIHDELADRVMENFRLAKSYRSSHLIMGRSVDEWFRRLHNAFHKIHEMEELEDRPNMSSYFGLTAMKVSATTSYMRSKFINLANPPFNISPTPIVELPKYKQEEGLERVKAQLLNKMIENDLPPEALLGQDQMFLAEVAKFVETEAKNAKEALQKEEYEIAFDATQKMVKLIKDQLVEGNFAGSTGEVIFDIALKPVAVWSFENEAVIDHVWKKNKFVKETIIRPMFRRVPPENAYFAPDCTNAQDGAFFIELAKRSKSQLASFIGNEQLGYRDEPLKYILEHGDSNWLGTEFGNDFLEGMLQEDEIHVLRCQMLVSGADLIEYGVAIKESEQFDYFNVDIEVCNKQVIRCNIVAHPKGERTYFSASYKRIAGEPYGISVGMMVYDRQLAINRVQYSMLLNASYSAGPMLEVNANAFDQPQEINMQPFSRVFSNPQSDGNVRGIVQHQINPTFPMLFQFLTNQIRLADDECGLPSFLNGNAGLQGAGQTLGGLAMMTDNAVLGLEDCAFNIDEYFIRPAITLMYARNLLGKDDSVKADAKIIATGLLGLKAELEKAKQQAGLMPQMGQLAQQGAIPSQMYADFAMDYLKTQGVDTERYAMPQDSMLTPNTQMQNPTEGYVDRRS
ncbi:hypothetical protein [Haemophilus parahaemolyticus]|uniref:hypothetical protein n=1 Tax=Haemophilus parahaemolyticus TaxID=735 RepID=UPI002492D34F|nr:hypothetical protein [Haemophilus parahaemolyticus]